MNDRTVNELNLNIPDRIYVGTKEGAVFNTENPPLGFATQADADSGFVKRKGTIDQWVGPRSKQMPRRLNDGTLVKDEKGRPIYDKKDIENFQEGQYLSNEPLSGFTFEKSVSRWSTSNKWFTINDPRGFQLQIAADNLGDIILNTGVLHGELQGEYVWAKNGSNIFLCRTNHPAYHRKANPTVKRKDLRFGDICLIGQDKTEWTFAGNFYVVRFGAFYRYEDNATGQIMPEDFRPLGYWHYGNRSHYTNKAFAAKNFNTKQVWAFYNEAYGIKIYASKPEKLQIIVENKAPFCVKVGQPYRIISSAPASYVGVFFDGLNDAKAYSVAADDVNGFGSKVLGEIMGSSYGHYPYKGDYKQYG